MTRPIRILLALAAAVLVAGWLGMRSANDALEAKLAGGPRPEASP